MGVEVLAEQLIATTAVEALAAELRVICNNTITNLEGLDFRAYTCNNTDGFVT